MVTSTAGNDPVLSRETLRSALAKRPARPLFLIDVAVPRDVEETVSELENVYLYNMDDVSAIALLYLDRPENELPRLASLPARTQAIEPPEAPEAEPE